MSASEKQVRLRALERLLPFFRLAPDADLVAVVLDETADIPTPEFVRRCKWVLREGEHGGNLLRELRKERA